MRMPHSIPGARAGSLGPCEWRAPQMQMSPKSGEAGGGGVKGQAQRPWNLSSDSSEPARGQVDLTEKLSEDRGWEGCGGNGGGSEASVP